MPFKWDYHSVLDDKQLSEFASSRFPRMMNKLLDGAETEQLQMLALVGLCHRTVQHTERRFDFVLKHVLKDHTVTSLQMMDGPRSSRRRSLGEFIKELRNRAKISRDFRETLYRFLEMRNTFVHDFYEVPDWSFKTDKGRAVAALFMIDLMMLSTAVSLVFVAISAISAREDLGEQLVEANSKTRSMIDAIEEHFGPMARKILAGRYQKSALVHSAGQSRKI